MYLHSHNLRITAYVRISGAELKSGILPVVRNTVNEGAVYAR